MTDVVKELSDLCLELDSMNSGHIPLSPSRHHEIIESITQIGKELGSREAMEEAAEQANETHPRALFMLNMLWNGIHGWQF